MVFIVRKYTLLFVLLFSLLFPANGYAGEILIIVNKNSPLEDISFTQLSKIYRGKNLEWDRGERIVVVNRDVRSDVRRAFYKKVLKSRPTQKFFLSRSPIPFRTIVQKSILGVTRFVASEKNAIGYVYFSELTGDERGIKILKVDGVIPNKASIENGMYKLSIIDSNLYWE